MDNIFAWLRSPLSAYGGKQSGPFTPEIQGSNESVRHYPINYYPGVKVKLSRYDRRQISPLMTVTQNGAARQV